MPFILFLFLSIFSILSTFSFSHKSHAVVDMRNANYSDVWTDMILEGSGYDLRVVRSYNSRSLNNGMFGFGWCSEFETNIIVTAEGELKLTECGGGLEIYYRRKDFNPKKIERTIQRIMNIVKKRNRDLKPEYFTKLQQQLRQDRLLREEFVKQLNLKGAIQKGVLYYAQGRENDSIQMKGDHYLRSLPEGSFQKFSFKTGYLLGIYDKNRNFIKIQRSGNRKDSRISSVVDNNGRQLRFSYRNKKVSAIKGPGKLSVLYKNKNEDLVQVKDSFGNVYNHKYDNLHNLIQTQFPDKTVKKIFYNKDKDWVIGFQNRAGCKESYTYKSNPSDPLNHYSSHVVKKCKNKIVNQSSYEFFHRKRKNGERYLHRAKENKNGAILDTTYHPTLGKPTLVIRNKQKAYHTYYSNGNLKEKKTSTFLAKFFYKNPCKKVSSVEMKYFYTPIGNKNPKSPQSRKLSQLQKRKKRTKKLKVLKTIKTYLTYKHPKCNLIVARNTEGQRVRIAHDHKGRITFLKDQAERAVHIKYDDLFGKPRIIKRPGLGTIIVKYKPNGEIKKVDSKEGPIVAAQVANVFSHLMDIITPVASNIVL